RKGVGELLEAVAILRERNVRCSVEVVGPAIGEDGGVSNEQLRRWRRVADCLGLSDRVQFTGPLRGAALEARWRRADCLVLPSHNEGMPYVVLEAGARRKAVIATQVGGIPDLLAPDRAREPLALLVRPCDPTELAGAMARLAGDARLREALADRLYEHVRRHYTIERQIRRLGEVYERIRPFTRTAGVSSRPLRRVDEMFCGTVLYPLHERLRGRSTRGELSVLQRLRRAERGDLESETRRRLRATLEHAERKTGYYRSLFARYGVDVRAKDIERELRKLPPLTKAEIRRHEAMMVDSDAPGGLIPYASGGTTGDTLKFSIDRIRQAQSIAARLAGQSWFGVRVGDRRGYLWGAPIESRGAGWRRMREALLNEIVLDAFDLSDEKMDEHLRRLARFRPRCLYAYPTAAARLAEYALRRKRRLCVSGLQLVVLTGEEVAEKQRDIVRRAFGCRVAAEYGSRETGTIAHECPYGRMHVFAPHAYVEVVRDGRPIGFGEVGEIVVTVLNTRAQPLIRYRIGDAGALEASACPCGSALPVMRVAGGKITGFIVLRDGRVAHGAVTSHMLRGEHGVIAYRTIQHDVNVFEVLLETDERFDSQAVQRIRRRYARVFGEDVRVDVRVVDRIAPDPSGKRRYVISHVAERMKSFRTVSPEAAQQPNVAPVDDVVTSRAHS
ncbi:MAG: glycosyltransferase, partial [Planctomycetota bacterium]